MFCYQGVKEDAVLGRCSKGEGRLPERDFHHAFSTAVATKFLSKDYILRKSEACFSKAY